MSDNSIRRLTAADWQLLRKLRLAALRDSPEAFASTYERELAFDEETWRSRCSTSCYMVAENSEAASGMAAVIVLSGEPPTVSPFDEALPEEAEAHLVSMWVAPAFRGRGIAGRLIAALSSATLERDIWQLYLWVVAENRAAVSAYERAGFIRTGELAPLPHSPEITEEKMRLDLSPQAQRG